MHVRNINRSFHAFCTRNIFSSERSRGRVAPRQSKIIITHLNQSHAKYVHRNHCPHRSDPDVSRRVPDLAAQQAIKALDIQVDGIKFAADVSVKLQLGLISGMSGLISSYGGVLRDEMEHNAAMTSNTNTLFGAVTAYYDTLVRAASTDAQAQAIIADAAAKQNTQAAQIFEAILHEQVQNGMTGAQVYAQVTNAALGGLHGVASASVT